MNDPNPYDPSTERPVRGDRFWVGFIVGAAACFAVMFALMLVAAGFLVLANGRPAQPITVPIVGPGGTPGGVDVPAEPDKIETAGPAVRVN
jgi:hypothetical protein